MTEQLKIPEKLRLLVDSVIYYESTAPSFEFRAARALVTADPTGFKLPWHLLLKLGIDPLKFPRTAVCNPYSTNSGDQDYDKTALHTHPLTLSAVFAEDLDLSTGLRYRVVEDSAQLLTNRDLPSSVSLGNTYRAGERYNCYPGFPEDYLIPCPGPEVPRLGVVDNLYFRLQHAAWYNTAALSHAIDRYSYGHEAGAKIHQMGEILHRAGRDPAVLKTAALRSVKKALAAGRGWKGRQYSDIAQAVYHCDPEEAASCFRELKGVHQAIALAIKNTPSDLMIVGLRQICKSQTKEVLGYLGRSPTIEELKQVRGSGIAELLYLMPWKFLAPLVENSEGALRTLVLKDLTRTQLDRLKTILKDHPHRIVQKVITFPGTTAVVSDNWKDFKTRIVQRYYAAIRYCELLETVDQNTAIVLAMEHLHPVERLSPIREIYELSSSLRAAAIHYVSPFNKNETLGRFVEV